MNLINFKKKNTESSFKLFFNWLESDIIKMNATIMENLVGSTSLISDL